MKRFILPILFFLSIYACQSRTVYDKYHSLPDEIWQCNEIIEFNANIPDSGLYDISIHIRYTYDLGTENIWCFLNTRNSCYQQLFDTTNIQITTDEGFIQREGGPLKTIEQPIGKNPVALPQGNTLFRLEQGLPIDVKGIKDVGICIKKSSINENNN